MRKGLELLYISREDINPRLIELENNNSTKLPDLYRRFILTYDTSRIKREMFYSDEFNGRYPCTSFKFNDNSEVGFSGFVTSIEEAFNLWREQDEVLKSKNFFHMVILVFTQVVYL